MCNEVVDKQNEHPCDRDPARREKAIKLCSKLKSPIFSPCHWHVDVEPFYQNCLFDLCSCATSIKSCYCPLLADYASECAREGVPLVWRTEVRECGKCQKIECLGKEKKTHKFTKCGVSEIFDWDITDYLYLFHYPLNRPFVPIEFFYRLALPWRPNLPSVWQFLLPLLPRHNTFPQMPTPLRWRMQLSRRTNPRFNGTVHSSEPMPLHSPQPATSSWNTTCHGPLQRPPILVTKKNLKLYYSRIRI